MFFGPQFFGGRTLKFWTKFFLIAPTSDHVAKFRGDRPRDRGDLALKKKKERKKERKKEKETSDISKT